MGSDLKQWGLRHNLLRLPIETLFDKLLFDMGILCTYPIPFFRGSGLNYIWL